MFGLVAHPMLRQAGRQASKQAGRQPPVEGVSHQTPTKQVHLLQALVVGPFAAVGQPAGVGQLPAEPLFSSSARESAATGPTSTPAHLVLDQPARTLAGQLHLQGNINKQHGVSGGVGGHT